MKLEEQIIIYKSKPPHYVKEQSGLKPHTEREIKFDEGDAFDDRLLKLIDMKAKKEYGLIKIEATNKDFEGYKEFEPKRITDISVWNHLIIISWKH